MTATKANFTSTAIGLALSLIVSPALAGTIKVSSNGVDSPTCGIGAVAPCATIAQAVGNASDGDTIQIGAGRYAGTSVGKRVKFQSKNGQGGAVITSPMTLGVDGIVLGLPGKGFALNGGGVCVSISANDVTVRGNNFTGCSPAVVSTGSGSVIRDNSFSWGSIGVIITGAGAQLRRNRFGYCDNAAIHLETTSSGANVRENVMFGPGTGVRIGGSNHLIHRNLAQRTSLGFEYAGTPNGVQLIENTAITTGGPSYYLQSGTDWTLIGNAAVGAGAPGFYLSGGPFTLIGNVAIGNSSVGILFTGGSGHVLTNNTAIDNLGEGIVLAGVGSSITVSGGNLYGNTTNCGLDNSGPNAVIADKIYWGSPSGPGADPADGLCGNTAAITVTNPRASAATIKMPKVK